MNSRRLNARDVFQHRQFGLAQVRCGIGRVAHQPLLLIVDDEATAVYLKLTVSGVAYSAGGAAHLEETTAVDGDVVRVAGGSDVALKEQLRHRRHAGAGADSVSAANRIGVHVGELSARHLGADGIRVRDVVADHLEALARGIETGQTLLEAHDTYPLTDAASGPPVRLAERAIYRSVELTVRTD